MKFKRTEKGGILAQACNHSLQAAGAVGSESILGYTARACLNKRIVKSPKQLLGCSESKPREAISTSELCRKSERAKVRSKAGCSVSLSS